MNSKIGKKMKNQRRIGKKKQRMKSKKPTFMKSITSLSGFRWVDGWKNLNFAGKAPESPEKIFQFFWAEF